MDLPQIKAIGDAAKDLGAAAQDIGKGFGTAVVILAVRTVIVALG